MLVTIRCEKCGKFMLAEAAAGPSVPCLVCKKPVAVPPPGAGTDDVALETRDFHAAGTPTRR